MKKIVKIALLGALLTTNAVAADNMNPYAGVALGTSSFTIDNFDYTGAVPLKINVGYGSKTNVGVEAEYSTDLTDATRNTTEVGTTTMALYVTYGLELATDIHAQARLGYLTGSYTASTVSGSTNLSGLGYGVQFSYDLGAMDVYFDYSMASLDTDTTIVDTLDYTTASIGIHYPF